MTISIKPTASETTIQENGSDVFTIDSSGITMAAGKTLPASALTGALPAIDGSALTGLAAGGFSNMDAFTSTGTWTNPGTVTKVKVTVVGGGGGGGNSDSENICASGGGAGGSAIEVATIPTSPVAVTVGGGGATGTTGGTGGTSSFGGYCSATGGVGGRGPLGVGIGGLGGTGSGGTINNIGGNGGSGNYDLDRTCGMGGSSIMGGGGTGRALYTTPSPTVNDTAGRAYGSGGGGGYSVITPSFFGGAGKSGIVIVEY